MKTLLAALLTVTLCVGIVAAQDAPQETGAKNMQTMAKNMGRGVMNLLTCWMEVPRNLWLETTRNPYYGYIVGVSDGAFLATARAFSGATDVVTFGLTGPGMHSDAFPDFIWDAKWSEVTDTQKAWNSFNVPKDALIKQQQAQETAESQ